MQINIARSLFITAFSLSAALFPALAYAYDGPEYNALPAPLLRMAPTPDFSVDRTEIYLSRDKMEITYALRSAADNDLARYLYLPLPAIDSAYEDSVSAFGPDLITDPLSLRATFNNLNLKFETVARASYLGMDVSDVLKQAGLPLLPFGEVTKAAIKKLSPDLRKDLDERGIISHWGAMWSLDTTYRARQIFAAGKTGELKLSYKPVFGKYVDSILRLRGKLVYGLDERKLDFLCLKPDQLATITRTFRALKKESPDRPYTIRDISMNILNANAQFASVADFTFTVDMRRPDDILAACGGKFTKTGPQRYVWKGDHLEEHPELKLFFIELD